MKNKSSSRTIENHLDSRADIQRYLEKKKELTVILFADLADSTKYKAERSFYDGLAKTRDHNKTISEIIHNYKGKVVKWIGDAVMARFDLDKAGVKPHNPINSAIKIQEEFEKRNSKLPNDLEKFKTRIGIGVGPVVDFYTSDAQGLTVDEAARIQALCKPGQILIHGKLRDMVDEKRVSSECQTANNLSPNAIFSRPVERRLKGISQTVPVVEVIWGKHPMNVEHEERKFSRDEKDRLILTLLQNTRIMLRHFTPTT